MNPLPLLSPYEKVAEPDPWRFVPHPEVWVMIAVLVVLYLYATRVVGPKAAPPGEPIITRSQSAWFFTGLVILWIAVDWPFHDFAEDYLYSAHMVQHLLLSWVVPPMMLMATPTWLARLVLGRARSYQVFRFFTRPLVAGILYNVVLAISHLPVIVNESVRWSGVHFTVHLVVVISALLMWTAICGPLPELRVSLPVQCLYLFLVGILTIIPSAWLTYAQDVVYVGYIHPWKSYWGLDALGDQQLAGFIMRSISGLYIGIIIVVLFFRWARQLTAGDDAERRDRDRERIARHRAEHHVGPTIPSGTGGPPGSG